MPSATINNIVVKNCYNTIVTRIPPSTYAPVTSVSNITVRNTPVIIRALVSLMSVIVNGDSKKSVVIQIIADDTNVDTNSFVKNFPIPQALDGMSISRAATQVTIAGGSLEIQVRNTTQYPNNDALSTPMILAEGDLIATPGAINTLYKKVNTDDRLKIYVTVQSGNKCKGLYVILEFSK